MNEQEFIRTLRDIKQALTNNRAPSTHRIALAKRLTEDAITKITTHESAMMADKPTRREENGDILFA
jgi:hypothetical protein